MTDSAFDSVVGHLAASLAELSVPNEIIREIGAVVIPLRPEIVSVAAHPANR